MGNNPEDKFQASLIKANQGEKMIDHIGIDVSDLKAAVEFYKATLAPLGYELLMEFPGFAGFGIKTGQGPLANFWLHQADNPTTNLHIAFTAKDRKAVDLFYQAGIDAGAKDHGKPGIREIYHPNYYGAFLLDKDGRNIEAVCHSREE